MDWTFSGDTPIYTQLMDKFKLSIVSGELAPGEKLSAVRELAVKVGVNPNTMQRALSELERIGLVYSQRTSGRYVTEDLSVIERTKKEIADARLRDFLSNMSFLGYTKDGIISLIMESEDMTDGNT